MECTQALDGELTDSETDHNVSSGSQNSSRPLAALRVIYPAPRTSVAIPLLPGHNIVSRQTHETAKLACCSKWENSFGRDKVHGLFLDDPGISSTHADICIESTPDGTWFLLADQGSRNKTFVSPGHGAKRQLLPMVQLAVNDSWRIWFGQLECTFHELPSHLTEADLAAALASVARGSDEPEPLPNTVQAAGTAANASSHSSYVLVECASQVPVDSPSQNTQVALPATWQPPSGSQGVSTTTGDAVEDDNARGPRGGASDVMPSIVELLEAETQAVGTDGVPLPPSDLGYDSDATTAAMEEADAIASAPPGDDVSSGPAGERAAAALDEVGTEPTQVHEPAAGSPLRLPGHLASHSQAGKRAGNDNTTTNNNNNNEPHVVGRQMSPLSSVRSPGSAWRRRTPMSVARAEQGSDHVDAAQLVGNTPPPETEQNEPQSEPKPAAASTETTLMHLQLSQSLDFAAEARPPQHLELASDAPGHTPASLDTPVNSQVWGDIHAQYSLCQDDDPPTQPSVDGATSALEPPARLPTNQKAASANLGSLLEEGPLQTAETRAADEDVDPAERGGDDDAAELANVEDDVDVYSALTQEHEPGPIIAPGLDIGITDKAAKDVPNANAISSPTSSTEALTEHGAGDPGPSRPGGELARRSPSNSPRDPSLSPADTPPESAPEWVVNYTPGRSMTRNGAGTPADEAGCRSFARSKPRTKPGAGVLQTKLLDEATKAEGGDVPEGSRAAQEASSEAAPALGRISARRRGKLADRSDAVDPDPKPETKSQPKVKSKAKGSAAESEVLAAREGSGSPEAASKRSPARDQMLLSGDSNSDEQPTPAKGGPVDKPASPVSTRRGKKAGAFPPRLSEPRAATRTSKRARGGGASPPTSLPLPKRVKSPAAARAAKTVKPTSSSQPATRSSPAADFTSQHKEAEMKGESQEGTPDVACASSKKALSEPRATARTSKRARGGGASPPTSLPLPKRVKSPAAASASETGKPASSSKPATRSKPAADVTSEEQEAEMKADPHSPARAVNTKKAAEEEVAPSAANTPQGKPGGSRGGAARGSPMGSRSARRQATSEAAAGERADSLDDSDVQAQTAVPVAERSQSEPNSASRGSKRGASANTPPQSSRHTKRAAASLADHVLGKQETLSGRLTTAGPVVVLFSANVTPKEVAKLKTVVQSLGGIVAAADSKDFTHFVAPDFKRTENMLIAIAAGRPVVPPRWLDVCSRSRRFVEANDHLLQDRESERKFQFNMKTSYQHAHSSLLLNDISVCFTPATEKAGQMLACVVPYAGGQLLKSIPTTAQVAEFTNECLVIATSKDRAKCQPLLDAGVGVYSVDLLLNGIVQQRLDRAKYRLFFETSSCNATDGYLKDKQTNSPVQKRRGQ